ncbi:MAG TPA: hypothetical protein VIN67_02165, partial [Desulfobaccales bacterium]
MARWFRRKEKDRKKSRTESEAAPPVGRESEAHPAFGDAEVPEQAEEGPAVSGLKELAAETSAELPEEPAAEAPDEPRRGFFARFRQ